MSKGLCSLQYPRQLEQCMVHNRCSINTCGVSDWKKAPLFSPWKPPLSKTRPPSFLTWKTSNASQLNWTPDLSTAPPQIQSWPWVIFLESKSLVSLHHLKPCSRFLIILRIKSKFLNETPPVPPLWPWLALLNFSVCPALSCTLFLPSPTRLGGTLPTHPSGLSFCLPCVLTTILYSLTVLPMALCWTVCLLAS